MSSNIKNSLNILKMIEWETMAIIFLVFSSWGSLVIFYSDMTVFISAPLLLFTLVLHSSMCHEIIHGHPTKSESINDAIGYLPLSLLFPYKIYKRTHLMHHNNSLLTLPGIDPESFFVAKDIWDQKPSWLKVWHWIDMTLAGRVLLHPLASSIILIKSILLSIKTRDISEIKMWLKHFIACSIIMIIASYFGSIPWWQYLIASYLSLSVIQLRAFFEHRPEEIVEKRSVYQQTNIFMRVLFLSNNYHIVHHLHPECPWYKLHEKSTYLKQHYLKTNGFFFFKGYSSWLKYLFKPIQSPIHPFYNSKGKATHLNKDKGAELFEKLKY